MCFSQNGRHLITASSLGVIYIWKLPESVSKLIGKKKINLNNLEKIDEEELEDSMKETRETPPKPIQQTPKQSEEDISPAPKEVLKFGKAADNLPRWAQSVVGSDPNSNSKVEEVP